MKVCAGLRFAQGCREWRGLVSGSVFIQVSLSWVGVGGVGVGGWGYAGGRA